MRARKLDAQKVMKTTLRSLIDEVSMVSSLNLTYVHMRMQEIFGLEERMSSLLGTYSNSNQSMATLCLKKMSRAAIVHKLGCIGSINIWKDCVHYDELTINERQKKDGQFSDILGKVRCGTLTEEILTVLKERIINIPVVQKLVQLIELGENPVCLFPTRKQCDLLNEQMLGKLQSEVHVIPWIDDVDETWSTAKWHQKAAKQLELQQHCRVGSCPQVGHRCPCNAQAQYKCKNRLSEWCHWDHTWHISRKSFNQI